LKLALALDAENGPAARWDGPGRVEIPQTVRPFGGFDSPASEPGRFLEQATEHLAECSLQFTQAGVSDVNIISYVHDIVNIACFVNTV